MSEPVTYMDSGGSAVSITQFATAAVCVDPETRELSISWDDEMTPAEWTQIRRFLSRLGNVELGSWYHTRDSDGTLYYGRDGRY